MVFFDWLYRCRRLFFFLYLLVCGVLLFGHLPFSHAPRLDTERRRTFTWQPLQNTRQYLAQLSPDTPLAQRREAALQLLGNLLLFAPLGAYLALEYRWPWWVVMGTLLLLTVLIETLQWHTRTGNFDIDDILLNTLGGTAAAVLTSLLRRS